MRNNKYIKDVLIFLAIIVFIILSIILTTRDGNANYVQVIKEGKIILEKPLKKDDSYDIDSHNDLVIENGQVYMKDADCPDKLCVKQGKINKDGQSIICLPNKVVVKIISNEQNQVDAVVK